MKQKLSSKRSIFAVSAVGIMFTSVLIFVMAPGAPAQGSYKTQASFTSSQIRKNLISDKLVKSIKAITGKQASSGLPIRLKIPEINLDATLESVGLTSEGAVGVPKAPANAAWFNIGPRPGEKGSAVIVGHYGRWKNGDGSVFDNVHILQKGDKIYVRDEKGTTITFVVRESKKYDPNANASDVFNSNDGKSHLNLITCEGVWNKVSKSYSKRLVVFTDKVVE